jgi:cell division protein FtsB
VLALVVCALALTLAYPLREFIAQRQQIADLRAETADQEQRVRDLQAQKDRWDDPAYVKAQAAQRLHWAMPGETPYIVLEPDETPSIRPAKPELTAATPPVQRPWFTDLWRTVERADQKPGSSSGAQAAQSTR